jgi:hypothetical protein
MKCCFAHEKLALSKDRKLFQTALNVKFGTHLSEMVSCPQKHETTSEGGLAFVGAGFGVPYVTQISTNQIEVIDKLLWNIKQLYRKLNFAYFPKALLNQYNLSL